MGLDSHQIEQLRHAAVEAASHAYCPYSHYPVGAAVLSVRGQIFSGCNVENASFGLTICAERSAIFRMIADAGAGSEVAALGVYTSGDEPAFPCGACRQVIYEFGADAEVIAFSAGGRLLRRTMGELLPEAFGASHVQKLVPE